MASSNRFRLYVENARQLVQGCNAGELFKAGPAQNELFLLANASLVVNHDGTIAKVDSAQTVRDWLNSLDNQPITFDQHIVANQLCVIPGLVDAHTHPVWSGNRVGEFEMKLAGATYLQVHESGGGIHSTVRATRQSSDEELGDLLSKRLDRMVKCGTTLIEAKSGYGLDTETELKMLRVLHNAKHEGLDIVSNYLGGHSAPEGQSAHEATENILSQQLPAIIKAKEKGEISPEFIDVFCEKGVFEFEDSKRILAAGRAAGLKINFHGDEINNMNSGKLAVEVDAHAISHLEMLDDENIRAISCCNEAKVKSNTHPIYAVLLPTTLYILNLPKPPARKLIENGVPIALGSDYNPNAHCLSMPMTMNMACILMKMTMNESLNAATINAAASLNKSDMYGSLEQNKYGDMILLEAERWEHLIYEIVDPPIQYVIKKGKVVYERKNN